MKRFAAVLLASLALAAHASPPDAGTPKAPRKKSAAKRTPGPVTLTLETLDRYIQYRREADAATQSENEALIQKAEQGGTITYEQLRKMVQREEALREKHGLSGKGFETLDQLVRQVSDARFRTESATAKAARESLEAQASGPPGTQRDMARAMLAQLQKDPHAETDLQHERERYGHAAVELVLQREKQLKELWDAKEEAAAKTQALPPASPRKP
jgi:hypothetical protein